MSQTCANTLYRTSDLSGGSDATCFHKAEPPDEIEERRRVGGWYEALAVVSNPTVGAAKQGYVSHGGSSFVTYLMPLRGQTRYRMVDITDAAIVVKQEDLDEFTPIFSLKPWSRIRVRAKVTVRPGRLSLIVPDVLEEAE